MSGKPLDVYFNGRFLSQEVTGVQRYGHELLYALDRIIPSRPNVRVTLVCPKLDRAPPALTNIAVVQRGNLQGHAWEQIELPLLSRGKVLFCPGNTAPAISLLGGQSVIVTVHDLSYLYFPDAYSSAFRKAYGFLVPLAFRRARGVITVSVSERESIISRYPHVASRLTAIQNGGLPNDIASDTGEVQREDNHILYVGSLSKRKNFPRMLEVACSLASKKGYKFTFVGGTAGGLLESKSSVPEAIQPLITFAGQVNDTEKLISFYRRATVFMFPSMYEASPLPPIEAMACGCPVVAGDIPSLRERCGDAALYCDPQLTSSIETQVETLMTNKAMQSDLAAKGRSRANEFSWNNCAAKVLDVIEAA